MMAEHTTVIPVRYAETDQMGTVHHASYPVYFEQARVEHMEAAGVPYHELEAQGVLLPVVTLTVEYLKPLRFGEKMTVLTRMKPVQGVRLTIEYEIRRGDELCVTGSTIHAFISRERRPMRPPLSVISRLAG